MTTPTANILATIPLPLANGASSPSLDIDFTTSPSLAGLGVTFSRTSTASYFDATGTLQSASSGSARYDYGISPGGVTNWLRNSTMANTGGIPTNWAAETDNATGYTVSYAYGVENSLNYVDVTLSGTPTSATYFLLYTDSKTALNIAYAAGQTWTHAANLRVSGGSLTNIPSVLIGERISDRTGAFVFNPQTTVSLTTTSTRYSATGSSGAVQAAYVTGVVQLLFTTGNPIQLTLRISAPQLEQSASPSNFVPTSGTAVNVGAVPLGLLVEESRTNIIRNSTAAGAAAGTPGTLPTNWLCVTGTITQQIVGTGTESGISFIDVHLSGTSSTSFVYVQPETFGHAVAAQNQVWTMSAYLRLVGGSLSNITSVALTINEDNGGFLISHSNAVFPTAAALATQRSVLTSTLTNASTNDVYPTINLFLTGIGAVIDVTLRIGLPQLELGAFVTSAIPTTSAAVTRALDNATMSLSNNGPGAMGVEYLPEFAGNATVSLAALSLNNGSTTDRYLLRSKSAGGAVASAAVVSANVGTNSGTLLTDVVGTVSKLAMTWAGGPTQNAIGNAGPTQPIASAVPSTSLTTLDIGCQVGTSQLDGWLRHVRYWPRQLQNGELIAQTSANPATFAMIEATGASIAATLPRPASNVGGVQAPTLDLDFLNAPHLPTGNCIRNPTMYGAAAPTTPPTNWGQVDGLAGAANGITTTIIGTGKENNLPYIEINYAGTANLSTTIFARFETGTFVPAANGQTWTTSCYVKLEAGSLNGTNVWVFTGERNSGGANIGSVTGANYTPTAAALSSQRISSTYTNASALCVYELGALGINITNGVTYNFTLRVGAPQMEMGSVPSPWISGALIFTRGSAANYFNASGNLTSAAFNTPRYDYNPATLVAAGLLIEEARTNLIRNNTNIGAQATDNVQRITNGSFGSSSTGWTVNLHGGTGSVTFGATTASLVGDNVNQTSLIQSITTIIGVNYTLQVTVATNPVFAEVGTISNGTDITSGVLTVGVQTLTFTAVGTTTWIGLAVTASAGSPAVVGPVSVIRSSVLPTNWSMNSLPSGVTASVGSVGVEAGLSYLDIVFNGTAGSSTTATIEFDPATQATAAVGQTWTGSIYTKLAAGTLGNVVFQTSMIDRGGTSTPLANVSFTPTASALVTQRIVQTRLTTQSDMTAEQFRLTAAFTSGWTYSFTLRIGMPQLELGNFASSVISTSGVAVSRNADLAQMPLNTTAFVQNAAGSLEVEYLPGYAGTASASNYAISVDDWTTANRYSIRSKGSGSAVAVAILQSNSVLVASGTLLTDVVGTISKLAIGWNGSTSQNSIGNNGTVQATSSAAPLTLTTLHIGATAGANQLNGWIRHVSYWPRMLSNTELGIETSIPATTFQMVEGATLAVAVSVPRPASNAGGATCPSLDLDFTNGTSMAALGITFGRNTAANYFNSSGVLTSASANVARYDYNPITLGAAGLLIEEQRVNSIRNNTMVGAVAGSPGTLPTNWVNNIPAGLTVNVIGTGTEAGITYIDLQWVGTTSGTSISLSFESNNAISAVQNQTVTTSFYVRLVGGTLANITALQVGAFDYTATTSFIGTNTTNVASPTAAALASQRVSAAWTIPDATAAFVRPFIGFSCNTASAVNMTIRVGMPQLELSSYATSVISTTGAAATRLRDDVSVTTGSWFNASAGSLEVEYDTVRINSSSAVQGGFSDGTFANSLYFSNLAMTVKSGAGPTVGAGVLNNAGIINKMAGTYASNNATLSVNGSAVNNATNVGTAPFLWTSKLAIGCSPWASDSQLNGHMRHVKYWPRALTSAELIRESTLQPTTFQMVDGPSLAVAVSIPRPASNAGGAILPSLDWDFTNAPSMASLGITFARTSTATYFDATGTLQTALSNVARYDYNPTTKGINGLLIEESRTNAVRNPRAEGAVAGTPGTVPTNWAIAGLGPTGLSVQILGVFTVNGISCLRVRFFGNPIGTGAVSINYESGGGLTGLTTSQSYTESFYIALSGGSWANIGNKVFWGQVRDSGNAIVQDIQPAIITPTSVLTRQSNVQTTPASGSTPFNMSQGAVIFYMGAVGPPVDFTVDFGAPQLEIGAFPTSVILPPVGTPGASTRQAETASIAVGSWFNASAGALGIEWSLVGQKSTFNGPVQLVGSNLNTDYITVDQTTAGGSQTAPIMGSYEIGVGGTAINGNTSGVVVTNGGGNINRGVMSWQVGSVPNYAHNGVYVTSASVLTLTPNLTTLAIAGAAHFQSPDCIWARRIRVWPRFLTTQEVIRESTVPVSNFKINEGETEAVGGSIPRPVAAFVIQESPAITASVSLARPVAKLTLAEGATSTVRAVLSLPRAVTTVFRGEVLSETSAMSRPTAVVRINEGVSVRAVAIMPRPVAAMVLIAVVAGTIRSANARPVARAEGSRINPTTRIAQIPAQSRTVTITAL